MSLKQIDTLLKPKSVAVIGASNRPNRPGYNVLRNLLQGEFAGPIMPVTPNYKAVNGVLAYRRIAELPVVPDLAIVCTRGARVPGIIEELGEIGTRNVIVIAAGMATSTDQLGVSQTDKMIKMAKRYDIRILGPHCLGIIVPSIGLNASYAHLPAKKGKIAFVSQSAAVCTTILDWAKQRDIGFSNFISLGDAVDIDFGAIIDFLGRDPQTQAILLYVDAIKNGRKFMSAARAASFTKPLLVIKGGKYRHLVDGMEQNISPDVVYDAAFRRAGMLRVEALQDLFAAVETLAHGKPLKGERLAILANGFASASMATDTLIRRGGRLSQLSEDTQQALSKLVPTGFTVTNPVVLLGDALPQTYDTAVETLINDKGVDNLLILHSPTALGESEAYADRVISAIKRQKRSNNINILVAWTGEESSRRARARFSKAGIASFRSPEGAVGAFMHMVQYRRNQKLLSETPESIPESLAIDAIETQDEIHQALDQGKIVLETDEAAHMLKSYGILTATTRMAPDAISAVNIANDIGYPIALKISCPTLRHKSKFGGVALNIDSAEELLSTAQQMLERVKQNEPNAEVEGFILQKMVNRAGAHELRLTVQTDPVFGPVIMLGEGGENWDIHRDAVVAFPPLNMALSRYLIIQALAEGKLRDRHLPKPIDRVALALLLTQVSHLVVDNPEIVELDINPLLAIEDKMTVLDVAVRLTGNPSKHTPLAIRPYPKELEEAFILRSGRKILLRPILPEDESSHKAFDDSLSKEDRYKRYFGEVPTFSHEQLARLTQIDYDREMAFIATAPLANGNWETLGVVRAVMDPDNIEAEFAIVVRSDMKGQGLGKKLLIKITDYCREHKTQLLTGITMLENNDMAGLAKKLGFSVRRDFEEGHINMWLDLTATAELDQF